MTTPSDPSGAEFSRFADESEGRWLLLAGLTVIHATYGEGVVSAVNERDRATPLFQIRFADSEARTFNAEGFRRNVFSAVRLSDDAQIQYAPWLEANRKIYEESRQALLLSEKYGVSEKPSRQNSILIAVLTKLDAGKELESTEIAWMEEENLNRPLATYFYRRFRSLDDPWELARACKYLRRANLAPKAIEVTEPHLRLSGDWPAAAYAAILTSRGGAFRDLENYESAKSAALHAARLSPRSPHPHNLLGALYLTEGLIAEGERHFDLAASLGGNESYRDNEYRIVMASTSESLRQQIATYLLSKDPEKYSWAASFAQRPEA